MDNITLISCSYNTPKVTINMVKSFRLYHPNCDILIVDNSTNNETSTLLDQYNIPYFKTPGEVHIKSVDPLLKRINTKYALLVDTDVIFKKDQTPIFEQFKNANLTLMGDICGDRGGKKIHYRVHPWYCFINVENIKQNNITFFNEKKHFTPSDKIYDVGCTFFSDIRAAGLKIGDIKVENIYYKHYEGMSWRMQKYTDVKSECGDIDFLPTAKHNDVNLKKYGEYILQQYINETQFLE